MRRSNSQLESPVLGSELDARAIKDVGQVDDMVNDTEGRLTLMEGYETKAS
jgi:hypothetical protein